MKVKISTWTNRGVTQDDIARWESKGLLDILPESQMIWTRRSASSWPKAERERYYETAGKVAKESGERRAKWNAERKAETAKIQAEYGKGVRTIYHICQQTPYLANTSYVTAHNQAFNFNGTPHYCESYLEPITQSPANVEPKTDEYTYCSKCEKECGWTADTHYDELGFCPVCGMDCILPENHPVRVDHREWAKKFKEMGAPNRSFRILRTYGDDPISAIDLSDEAERIWATDDPAGLNMEAGVIEIFNGDTPESMTADYLWCPEVGRLGIAWGADAVWADAHNLESGIEMWLNNDSESER